MPMPRHPTRHIHATIFNMVSAGLAARGWVTAPINFGTTAVTLLDFQPDEKGVTIEPNTVAVTLGDVGTDTFMELGAGLWSRRYPVFIDAYGATTSITEAICDDIRASLPVLGQAFPVVDQTTMTNVVGCDLEVESLLGPERPSVATTFDGLKRNWRVMRGQLLLQFDS
jgi:hypothetical protein